MSKQNLNLLKRRQIHIAGPWHCNDTLQQQKDTVIPKSTDFQHDFIVVFCSSIVLETGPSLKALLQSKIPTKSSTKSLVIVQKKNQPNNPLEYHYQSKSPPECVWGGHVYNRTPNMPTGQSVCSVGLFFAFQLHITSQCNMKSRLSSHQVSG